MKRHQMPLAKNTEKRLGEIAPEIRHILDHPDFKRLKKFPRHGYTNTHDHSIRVAEVAVQLAEKMGVDKKSAARVGLLHDMCYVSYYKNRHIPKEERHPGMYAFYHPEEAAQNAKKFGLTKEELHAIRAHMFPLAVHMPKDRLGLVLTLSDKKVSALECAYSLWKKMYHRKMEMR